MTGSRVENGSVSHASQAPGGSPSTTRSRAERERGADARDRLVEDASRAARDLASEPAYDRAHHARFALRDARPLGAGVHLSLQRRVPPGPRQVEAPVGHGKPNRRELSRGLGHRRALVPQGLCGRSGRARRHAAPARPQRVPRGVLLHALVQSDQRRRRRDRRVARRRQRDHRASPLRAAPAHAARPRRHHHLQRDARSGLSARGKGRGPKRVRSAIRALLRRRSRRDRRRAGATRQPLGSGGPSRSEAGRRRPDGRFGSAVAVRARRGREGAGDRDRPARAPRRRLVRALPRADPRGGGLAPRARRRRAGLRVLRGRFAPASHARRRSTRGSWTSRTST